MLVVNDVEAASAWFQQVLGLASGHGGPEYEMLMDGDEIVAQLHHWEVHHHPYLGDPADASRGNGVAVWFAVDDFDRVLEGVAAADAEVLEGPLVNPNAGQREIWLQGPDGYLVVAAGPRPD